MAVERRLALKEVQNIAAASLALAADIGQVTCAVEAEFCPDKAVGVFILLCLLALPEPLVLLRGVSRNQVKEYADPFFVRYFEQVE